MKNTINFLKAVIFGASITLAFLYIQNYNKPVSMNLGYGQVQQTFSGMTNTRPTIASTTTLLLSANSGRILATICNPTTFNGYLTAMPASVTATTTAGATGYFATSTGITIFPSTCTTITDTGKIYGIIATTTSQTFSAAEISAR